MSEGKFKVGQRVRVTAVDTCSTQPEREPEIGLVGCITEGYNKHDKDYLVDFGPEFLGHRGLFPVAVNGVVTTKTQWYMREEHLEEVE